MRGLKLLDRFKSTQIHALNPPDSAAGGSNGVSHKSQKNKFSGFSKPSKTNSFTLPHSLLPYGLPSTEFIEPPIDPYLKSINLIQTLAKIYRRLQSSPHSDMPMLCIEQYTFLRNLGDSKLLRRCLLDARKHASDVHSKVVLSAWLRYDRREDELVGLNPVDCTNMFALECTNTSLLSCSCPNSCHECPKARSHSGSCPDSDNASLKSSLLKEDSWSSIGKEFYVTFCIGYEEIKCVRSKIAALSAPFSAMLYGDFVEARNKKIYFSSNGVSVEGMRALELYSRVKRLDLFGPDIVLELLSFGNRYCCEELISACDVHLASVVSNVDEALILIEYGLEEGAHLIVASCLHVFLSELPSSLYNPKVVKLFCSAYAKERLVLSGHGSFLLYYLLSQVGLEEKIAPNTTIMLLQRMSELATENWQKSIAFHQLGCLLLERKEYDNARHYFEASAETGHVYSLAGVARTDYKQGRSILSFELMSSVVLDHKPSGWMYQEKSLYSTNNTEKISDLNVATEMDPTLSFPYKYRAVDKAAEGKNIKEAILEIDRILAFKITSDCLELRAWLCIAVEDYGNALRDIRALLTLEPNYMMFYGEVSGYDLVEVLSSKIRLRSQADCWMDLYERWSSVDDIGSLAVIHQMLVNDPGKSLLRFRQSLLLLRLNCQKAAMRCLRLARNHSDSEHERLVYEGWILYDTGHHEEALTKAEDSISVHRSFEAFFLKAYILADRSLDPESSSPVIKLLEDALKCPSDGLRKGQALNNLGSIYVDCGKLDLAANCYMNALEIRHTRAHQGLARVYFLRNQRKAAHDEMTKLIEKAHKSSAYEKRSEYCERETAKNDLNMATQLDPLRTYPYRYRAAVLMDDQKETEAVKELGKAIAFKPDSQMLHLRAAFYESMGDINCALEDCEAALCLDPNHTDTSDLYIRARETATIHQRHR